MKGMLIMILLIGATGNIGIPIIRNLIMKREKIRVFVHSSKSLEKIKVLGDIETFVGDFRKSADLRKAMEGCQSVFHVAPPFCDDETEIGYRVIENARAAGVEHFVFNSAFHSQLSKLDHHARKLSVEEAVLESGLSYNIVQPAMLMQNIQSVWTKILKENVFPVFCAPDKKLALVDIVDVGEAIANILTDPTLRNATFELASQDMLTFNEMAAIISEELGHPISVQNMDYNTREAIAHSQKYSSYGVQAFLKMTQYYDGHGFCGGNPLVLASILKRSPNNFRDFVIRCIME